MISWLPMGTGRHLHSKHIGLKVRWKNNLERWQEGQKMIAIENIFVLPLRTVE